MANELTVKQETFLSDVSTELTQRLINESKALGGKFNSERFVINSIEALRQLELIDKPLSPKEVANGLIKGAYLGLDFFKKECYLIYYRNTGLQFQTDYRGEVKLARMYSVKPIFAIYAEVVRVGDEYEKITVNSERTINHRPLRFNNGEIEGAYAVVIYTDGSKDLVEISKKDIEVIRTKYSKAPNSPAWQNRYVEMCKKTALRLLCKNIQLDFSAEQYKAYQDGGDCEFENNNATHTAINPFDNTPATLPPETVVDAEVVDTPSTSDETVAEPEPASELLCSACGQGISQKVYDYSLSKFGKALCFKCQKKGNK